MFTPILFSTIAAATLLTTAPAFAAEDASKQPCSCCSDGSIHEVDHPLRNEQQKKASPERAPQRPGNSDDPSVRNQSFGG